MLICVYCHIMISSYLNTVLFEYFGIKWWKFCKAGSEHTQSAVCGNCHSLINDDGEKCAFQKIWKDMLLPTTRESSDTLPHLELSAAVNECHMSPTPCSRSFNHLSRRKQYAQMRTSNESVFDESVHKIYYFVISNNQHFTVARHRLSTSIERL